MRSHIAVVVVMASMFIGLNCSTTERDYDGSGGSSSSGGGGAASSTGQQGTGGGGTGGPSGSGGAGTGGEPGTGGSAGAPAGTGGGGGGACVWIDITADDCSSGIPIADFCPDGRHVTQLELCTDGTSYTPDAAYQMYLLSGCPDVCAVVSDHVAWRRIECCL